MTKDEWHAGVLKATMEIVEYAKGIDADPEDMLKAVMGPETAKALLIQQKFERAILPLTHGHGIGVAVELVRVLSGYYCHKETK